MPTIEVLINFFFPISLIGFLCLSLQLVIKMEKVKNLQSVADGLRKSLDEMDEQAKLIVRTDLELNKTQEELDKKVVGLYALQRLSRAMSMTLEENQIFKIINVNDLEDLGFEKSCGFLWSEKEKKPTLILSLGYSGKERREIESLVEQDMRFYLDFIQNGKTLSSSSIPKSSQIINEKIINTFKATFFVISAVLPKEGDRGFLFVGTQNSDTLITEGDEELITILANQLGQALENTRLFEQTWRSHQDLERKVEERTRQLSQALDEVKTISQRKTDFVSAVSHELRTPLTSIKGYASILLAGKLGDIPKEVQERLEKINRHSDELTNLVNELLDIARIESGKMTMKQQSCNLKDIAEKVLDLLAVQIKEKRLETSLEISDRASEAYADPSQIERVIINLIGNAIKFTPPKGKISIISHKEDKQVRVDITDTGCGMPEGVQEKIFHEFYRVDNPINEEVRGTGLGLSLVKHIIGAHKGKIWVESKIGAGSTFSFTLPTGA